jgi:hypothetical protein
MLSLAVQHWGMLPLAKHLRLQSVNSSLPARFRALSKIAHSYPDPAQKAKGSSGSKGAGSAAPLNRSLTADPAAGAKCVGFAVVRDRDIAGGDMGSQRSETVDACCQACRAMTGCCGWAFVRESKMCWMKSSLPNQFPKSNVTAGVVLEHAHDSGGSSYVGGVAEFTAALAVLRKIPPPPPPPPPPRTPPAPVKCCEHAGRYGSPAATGDAGRPLIWMDRPARDFSRGFLVGNGRLGAQLRFERWEDRLDLSEESVWAGQPVEKATCKLPPEGREEAPETTPPPAGPPKTWWEGPLQDRFLPGQSNDVLFANETLAKEQCVRQALTPGMHCSGLTREANGQWMLRVGFDAQSSPTHEVSWILRGIPSQTKAVNDVKTFELARSRLLEGDLPEAHRLMTSLTTGQSVNGFEYLARLRLSYKQPEGASRLIEEEYARRLRLDTAVASASFIVTDVAKAAGGDGDGGKGGKSQSQGQGGSGQPQLAPVAMRKTEHSRESFSSVPDDVIWARASCQVWRAQGPAIVGKGGSRLSADWQPAPGDPCLSVSAWLERVDKVTPSSTLNYTKLHSAGIN